MAARTVRLYLVDGTSQGLRAADVGNWTGKVLVGPRTELGRLQQQWPDDVHRTGVYVLAGPSEEAPSGHAVYVGEADDVWKRLRDHRSKDFWTWVVIFVSKDGSLTKAHVRWLERMLYDDISKAKRAEVENLRRPLI